eukprot:TRINITY_DN25620_c0_g1_i1.p1 TRINITY_DN25620_c0_g1~~TRINITY_DN25620_c0_g1_i1.p1  ORF type:complete len:211 (-),score=19.90 TRINITY_DN25620_c0_g1_i1:13-645(-)
MSRLALDLIEGITEFSSRMALKMLFGQFGEVTACWVPPLDFRGKEPAYVKFQRAESAQAALDAIRWGQLYLDGVKLGAEWRMAPSKTQDSRDFDAKGSNLTSSRDIVLHRERERIRRDERDKRTDGKKRYHRRSRSRSRGRRRSRSRKRSRSTSRKRKRSDSGSSSGGVTKPAACASTVASSVTERTVGAVAVRRKRKGGADNPICIDSD